MWTWIKLYPPSDTVKIGNGLDNYFSLSSLPTLDIVEFIQLMEALADNMFHCFTGRIIYLRLFV